MTWPDYQTSRLVFATDWVRFIKKWQAPDFMVGERTKQKIKLLIFQDLRESLQAQEKNLPETQKRAIPMITVPANERVFKAKINVGMETSRAG